MIKRTYKPQDEKNRKIDYRDNLTRIVSYILQDYLLGSKLQASDQWQLLEWEQTLVTKIHQVSHKQPHLPENTG